MVRVLFVCMGNICRSPTAEGVFAHLAKKRGHADRIGADSAGTIAFHTGEPPDLRAQQTALKQGVDLSAIRARQVRVEDFHEFDYVLAMDWENFTHLSALCPQDRADRVRLFCEFASNSTIRDVPDPYFGGPQGFADVFRLVEDAANGLLDHIEREHFGARDVDR